MERIDKNTDAAVDIRRVLSIDVGGSRGSKKKRKKKNVADPVALVQRPSSFQEWIPQPLDQSESITKIGCLIEKK